MRGFGYVLGKKPIPNKYSLIVSFLSEYHRNGFGIIDQDYIDKIEKKKSNSNYDNSKYFGNYEDKNSSIMVFCESVYTINGDISRFQ